MHSMSAPKPLGALATNRSQSTAAQAVEEKLVKHHSGGCRPANSICQKSVVGENPKHVWSGSIFQDKLCPYVFDPFTCNSLN